MEHLLPTHTKREQAAFLFARVHHVGDEASRHASLQRLPFLRDHFELCDESHTEVIKRAHDLRAFD